MMNINERIKVPIIARTRQRIPRKAMIEQANLTYGERTLFSKSISSIYLVAELGEATMHIREYVNDTYCYASIFILEINLKQRNDLSVINEKLQQAFPNPVVIIYQYEEDNIVSLASKRINKLDNTKTVIEELILEETDLEEIKLSSFKDDNLKTFYEDMIEYLYKLRIMKLIGVMPVKHINYKNIIKTVDMLNAQIKQLEVEYKKEIMQAKKASIDEMLYNKEVELKQVIKNLQEDI